ncbi:LPS-assembly protein LptD [Candidatus Hartigia pinicola]|nr:LPS-assembly protein LptD [Candidatus Hartigia pinicola]
MMKRNYPTTFNAILLALIYSQQAYANLSEQCMLGVPVYTKPIIQGESRQLSINITAKNAQGAYPNIVEYKGDVNIQQGNKTLTADKVKLTQTHLKRENPIYKFIAIGNVHYDDPQIILQGLSACYNLHNQNIDVDNGSYMIVGRQGRGDAKKIKIREKNRFAIMKNSTFTTCLPGNKNWNIVGSTVIVDREKEVVEIWHARFYLGDIPMFYSPYMQFPIGNTRRSGFLIPTVNYSKNDGLEISLPYYWDIDSNYDLTITPQFITHRGIKLNNEFRYLLSEYTGTIAFDFINRDRVYFKHKENGRRDFRNSNARWLFSWRHSGIYDNHWNINVDYTKVSDRQYLTDFNSQYGSTTASYVTQKFSTGYTAENWNATLSYKQFQFFLDDLNKRAYKAAPQLDFNYYKNHLGFFDFRTYAQASRFTSIGKNNPDATRLHIECELSAPLSNDWVNINNSLKLLATHYNQEIPNEKQNEKLAKNVTRVLPMFKSDLKVVFERNLFDNRYFVQTLEPRVEYLYIPYKCQNHINNYDSAILQSDYTGLFRDSIYSGLDRIASANQLTTGITTRIYDKTLTERFKFSIGQIYYLERLRAGNKDLHIDDKGNTGLLLCATDSSWRINDNWGVRVGLQYDHRLGSVTMGNAVTEYRVDSDRLLQLKYRFVDSNYIQETFYQDASIASSNVSPEYQQGISQIGAVLSWPLSERWGFIGSYYYDTKQQQSFSQIIGLQYNTCCWAFNIGYERKIIGWQNKKFNSEYDNRWTFNLELRGLNNHHSFSSQEMLSRGVIPYQQAFEQ